MRFDAEKVWLNVRKAETEDLLDRVTAFRAGMEPDALPIIEEELARRGVDEDAILAWREKQKVLMHRGLPAKCTYCPKPAFHECSGWHRLWGVLPLFRRRFFYCQEHWTGS